MSEVPLPKVDWPVVFNRANPPGWKGWGRVRAAQITELRRAAKIAAWGQSFNALLLAAVTFGSVEPLPLALWLGAMSMLLLLTAREIGFSRQREIHSVSRKLVDKAAYYAAAYGGLWSIPALFFFPEATHPQQLAICLVMAGMMAGAAFLFAAVPPAAAAYVFVVGAAVTGMLSHAMATITTLIGAVYTVGLLVIIYGSGAAFMRRRCMELALEERSETVSLLLRDYETSDADWLWQTNRNLAFQNVSGRFARAIGYSVRELEGTSILDVLDKGCRADPRAFTSFETIAAAMEDRAPFTEQLVPIEGAEGPRCIELSARPRFNSQGRFIGYRGVGSDVTEARAAADRITHMARHDALTGLPNRMQLLEALGDALDAARVTNGRCAVLLLDLDRFKSVNDSLGHVAGDHLLRQVSARLEPILSDEITAGRLGGDEFALVIPRAGDADAICALCRDVIEALKRPFVYNDQHLFVGASIGVAIGPIDGDCVEDLIRNADLALYRSKGKGGNDICFYEPGLHADAEERRLIELAMRTALDNGELSLVYQPVIDAAANEVRSCEALLRWTNPQLGCIPPAKFVPIAEETGLIGRIGEWVLRTALAEVAHWPANVSVAVNISPIQLQEPNFVLSVVSALSQGGLDAHRVELEITETVFLHINPMIQKMLQQIQALGVRLAIDDFGTGYSSLSYLRDSNFDTVKIDRSFVQAVTRDNPESSAIVKAVMALAGSLGMATVAEGVETEEQLEIVRSLGCDLIQGYIFSDPLPSASVRSLLNRPNARAAA
jgi:diguanylate cyclase (GGDEF)-like protein